MSTQASVQRIINKKGNQLYSIDIITSSLGDPNYPTKGPTTSKTSYSILAYAGKYKNRQIDGELIQANDIKLYVATTDLTITPSTKDQVSHSDGRFWNIKNVMEFPEGEGIVLYILQLRK